MMKKIVFILVCFITSSAFAQIGKWKWASADGRETFELHLYQHEFKGAMQGSHCAVIDNGTMVDCATEEDKDYLSINLMEIGQNAYKGNIRSYHSFKKGEVQITYDPIMETLHFQLSVEPGGEHFIPKQIVMRR